MSTIAFKFDNKLKARISKLCSSHSSSKQNRKMLDEIFLSVAEQSPAMKKLWLSIYAGTLRVIPDVKDIRQMRDTAHLLTDIAERRVRELPQSMEQAKAVSEMIMTHLKGDSETILAADIGTATSALLSLFGAVHAELKKVEKTDGLTTAVLTQCLSSGTTSCSEALKKTMKSLSSSGLGMRSCERRCLRT